MSMKLRGCGARGRDHVYLEQAPQARSIPRESASEGRWGGGCSRTTVAHTPGSLCLRLPCTLQSRELHILGDILGHALDSLVYFSLKVLGKYPNILNSKLT